MVCLHWADVSLFARLLLRSSSLKQHSTVKVRCVYNETASVHSVEIIVAFYALYHWTPTQREREREGGSILMDIRIENLAALYSSARFKPD